MAALEGTEVATSVRRSQVYQATHDRGGNLLPYMYRSFISFTYGGKKIEDFDLIATISGDRLNRKGYANFDDTVTSYDNLDGQHYWATHYRTNQLDLTLSTDGIDQKQLDNFLHWFKAGVSRELILAEHPNRAIMARVSQPPTLNLLPFAQDVSVMLSSASYQTKTTLYKGDIELSLVMDKPHWYAIKNILGEKVTKDGHDYYEDIWIDVNTGNPVSIFASQDALKVLYEDGIPLGSMISNSMLLGNGAYANVDTQEDSKIWSKNETDEDFLSGIGARIHGTIIDSEVEENTYDPLVERWSYPNGTYYGVIAGAIIDASEKGIDHLGKYDPNSENPQVGFFFYAGTAPAYTQISFTLTPEMSDYKIVTPCSDGVTVPAYNTITIESTSVQTLRFTTPNVFTSYNKAIALFDSKITSNSNYSWEKLRKELRDTIRHPAARAWAISVIEYAENLAIANGDSTGKVKYEYLSNIKTSMSYFLTTPSSETPNVIPPATFLFNSETGEAKGTFRYRKISILPQIGSGNTWDLAAWGQAQDGNFDEIEEDVGDMLRSNYIIIQDRNYPDEFGKIVGWSDTEVGRKYSHRIIHDVNTPLTNLSIIYKNMYL